MNEFAIFKYYSWLKKGMKNVMTKKTARKTLKKIESRKTKES